MNVGRFWQIVQPSRSSTISRWSRLTPSDCQAGCGLSRVRPCVPCRPRSRWRSASGRPSACTARSNFGCRPSRCLPKRSAAISGPSPAGRVVKHGLSLAASSSTAMRRNAAEQPVRGHHDQARIVHRHAHHQRVVGRMLGREEAAVVDLVAVVAGGLVAVVAVGDEDRLWAHHGRASLEITATSVTGQRRWTTPR